MTERKADLKFGVDGSAVKTGVAEIKRDVGGMAADVKRAGKEASDGIKGIGDQAPAVKEKIKGIGDQAPEMAKKMEAATRSMANSLQREIALLEAGSKSSREYRESLIKMRGGDLVALKPLLDQLDAAKAKSEAAARAHKQLGDSAAVAGRDHDQLAKRINVLGTAADFARGQLLALASGLSLGAMAAWVQHINDGVDALNDIKDATGASIENISALEDVGRRTGASFETVGSILVKFNDVLSKATPKSDIANALKAVGLEAEALKRLDPAEALRVTAVALSGYADDANKARLIQDLFGKSVKEAAPFLADLAEKGELVAKRTQAQADAADAFNKKIFDLKATSNDLSRDLVDKMLPGLTQIIDAMGKGAKEGGALLAVWRGLKEFGSIAFGTDKLGTAMSDAKAQAAELQRLNNLMIGAQGAADRDPDNERAQRRVAGLRKQIEDTMKAATAASEKVKELVNGPTPAAAPNPPEPPKPSIKPPKTAAEIAAAEAAAKKAADERKKALEEEAKLLAELSGLSGSFAKDWELLNTAFANGKLNTEQLQEAQKKLLEKQPFMQAQRKQEAEDLKTATEAAKQRVDAYNKEVDGIERWLEAQDQLSSQTVKGIQDRITAMDQEEEALTLAERQNISLSEAINRVRVARLREKRDGATGYYEGSDEWNRITSEINALDTEADRINARDRRDKTRDDNRRAKEEIDRWIDDTGRGLGDAVETAIRDGSEAGGKKMREVLQEQLLRKPLRMVIDGVLNQVTGGVLSMIGLGGGGGVMGGAGGGGGLLSLASNASSLYNGASAVGSIFSGAQGLGTLSSFSAGYSGAVLPASMVGPSLQAPTVLSNLGYLSNTGSLAAGSAATPGAAGMGAWGAGGIAAMIMLAVINMLGGMRSETMIGSGLAGKLGDGSALTPWQEWREGGTLIDGPSFSTHNPLEALKESRKELQRLRDAGQGESNYAVGLQAIVTDLEKTTKGLSEQTAVFDREINKGYKTYRDNVVKMADSLGLAGSSVSDFVYDIKAQDLNFQGLKPEEIQAKIATMFGVAGDEMAKQLLGSWREVTDTVVNTYVSEQMTQSNDGAFITETTVTKRMEYVASAYAKTGETAIQTLERLSKSFNTLNEASDALGFGIHQGSLALADFADDFIEAFGGLERFSATTSAYLSSYYSNEERRQYLLRSGARQANRLLGEDRVTAESLEQLGNAGIRAFVDGLVEGGATAGEIADAMDLAVYLAPAFESLDAAAEPARELADTVDELTQAFQNAVKSLAQERQTLLAGLARSKGDEVGARAIEREAYLDSFVDDKGNKLDDTRRAILAAQYDSNQVLKDEIDLRKEMLDLTDTNAKALERQRAALSESNKALFDNVQALRLQKSIAEELPAVLDMYRTPEQQVDAGYEGVAQTLRAEGFWNVTGAALEALSKDELAGVITAVYNLGTTSDSTRLTLIRAAASLSNLKEQSIALASSRTDAAYAALEREAGLRRTVLEESIADVRAVFDAVSDAARSLYEEVASTSQMMASEGRSFIEGALSTARLTGYLPDGKELQEAISAATSGIGRQVYATQFDADRDRLVLAGQLSELGDISGDQLSEQEKQLKALDGLLEGQRDLIDATRGVDTRVLGVDARIAMLTQAILAEQGVRGTPATSQGGQPAGGVVYGDNGAYYDARTDVGFQSGTGLPWTGETIRGIARDLVESGNAKAIYDALDREGYPLSAADAILHLEPGSAEKWARDMGLDVFHDGTSYVPRTALALLEEGEAVIPKAHNPFPTGRGFGDTSRLEAQLARLTAEVQRLQALQVVGNTHAEAAVDLWDNVTEGGNGIRAEIMNKVELAT